MLLCEKGHPMALIAVSEDEAWICDLCHQHSLSRPVRVQAWRCSYDKRLTKQADGCDYDICSQCAYVKRCLAEISETGRFCLIFAEARNQPHNH